MAQVLTISSQSVEYVLVDVGVKVGGVSIDPTADTVQMAFVAPGTAPSSGDWKSASWEITVGSFGASNTYAIKCLVGPSPGTVQLAAGGYATFVRINDNPETIVRLSGDLRVIP